MTARTINEQRRRALRLGRIAQYVLRAGMALDLVVAARLAVSVHAAASAFFLFTAMCFAAFDTLALGPMMRATRMAMDHDVTGQADCHIHRNRRSS